MSAPSPYSISKPNLQIVWDSTSLRALQFCPRNYQLAMLQGWRGSSVDLEFGIFFASAVETFKKARAEGATRDEAQIAALRRVIEDSWQDEGLKCFQGHDLCHTMTPTEECPHCEHTGKPWGGTYEEQWRCTGENAFKNEKGNRAKCPWSHKGKWFPSPAPHTCGTCGSSTEIARRYAPNDRVKNRETLVRLVGWYCDEQPQDLDAGPRAITFPGGRAAVELSWKLPLPFRAGTGEPFVLSGHFDSIMTTGLESFVSDNKTTKGYISSKDYWKQYSPNTQIETYDLAGSLLYPELNLRGVMIEAAQVTREGAHFASRFFYRTEAQREEFLNELGWWLKQAERYVDEDYWPMNRVNCKFCDFNQICSKEPAQRERYLRADYQQKRWNPLEER